MREIISSRPDPVWEAALDWVQRQHDTGFEDPDFNAALNHWLQADPAHRRAYGQAARIWAVAGLVPPGPQAPEDPGAQGSDDPAQA